MAIGPQSRSANAPSEELATSSRIAASAVGSAAMDEMRMGSTTGSSARSRCAGGPAEVACCEMPTIVADAQGHSPHRHAPAVSERARGGARPRVPAPTIPRRGRRRARSTRSRSIRPATTRRRAARAAPSPRAARRFAPRTTSAPPRTSRAPSSSGSGDGRVEQLRHDDRRGDRRGRRCRRERRRWRRWRLVLLLREGRLGLRRVRLRQLRLRFRLRHAVRLRCGQGDVRERIRRRPGGADPPDRRRRALQRARLRADRAGRRRGDRDRRGRAPRGSPPVSSGGRAALGGSSPASSTTASTKASTAATRTTRWRPLVPSERAGHAMLQPHDRQQHVRASRTRSEAMPWRCT